MVTPYINLQLGIFSPPISTKVIGDGLPLGLGIVCFLLGRMVKLSHMPSIFLAKPRADIVLGSEKQFLGFLRREEEWNDFQERLKIKSAQMRYVLFHSPSHVFCPLLLVVSQLLRRSPPSQDMSSVGPHLFSPEKMMPSQEQGMDLLGSLFSKGPWGSVGQNRPDKWLWGASQRQDPEKEMSKAQCPQQRMWHVPWAMDGRWGPS